MYNYTTVLARHVQHLLCMPCVQVDELLLILSHPCLSPEKKSPFARFLIWVYLNTEGDKYQSGVSSLSGDRFETSLISPAESCYAVL